MVATTSRGGDRSGGSLPPLATIPKVQDELQQRSTLVFRMMQPAQVLLEHMLEIGTLWSPCREFGGWRWAHWPVCLFLGRAEGYRRWVVHTET